jgi:serine/threonine-protein kinase
MSPEQVEGQPVDQRSDIYALGLLVYEMLTGDVPFTGDSAMQVMFKRIKEKPKNPRTINPAIPEYLARIVLRCLEKKPTDRYLQAGEILADLNAHRASSHGFTMKFTIPRAADRPWWWVAGAAVLVAALALGAWRTWRPRPGTDSARPAGPVAAAPAGPVRYVAVLPFRILGDEKALGYLGEGLIEGLTAKLSQLPALRVSARSAVEEAKSKGSMDKIARALGVKLVVSGVIQPSGDRLRVIVNVDDMEKGQRMWGQEFTGIAQDLLALEDQIYAKVVPGLGLEATGEEIARAIAHPTENLEAYDLYLRGRGALRGQQDVRKLEEAVANFEQALKKDRQFALAYAGLSDAQMQLYTEKKDQIYAERALGAAQQALRLDDKLPEVHFSLGSVFSATGRTSEAIAELKRALTLAPNSDEGHRRLGHAFMRAGRTAEAVQAFQKAIDVNPYFWLNHSALAGAYFQVGENEKALAGFRKVTELEPDNPLGHENLGSVYFRQGKWNQCIPFFEKALALEPYWSTYSNLGTAYFYLKRYPDAVKMFEKSVEMNPNEEMTLGNLADALRWSGQKDKAQAKYDAAIALAYKELRVNPRDANTLGNLALYYAKKGDDPKGLDFIRRARSIDQNSVALMYNEAIVHALGKRVPQALRSLRDAVRTGYSAAEAQNDPEFESLRTHPDFVALRKSPAPSK